MKRISILLPMLAVLLAFQSGCQSSKLGFVPQDVTQLFSRKDVEEEPPTPVRMAVIWKDGVYEAPGKPKIRGLGGRIYFYDADDKPIQAEGELIVYGFDDTESMDSQKPRKFIFPQEEFQQYFSETDLGESYSVWVPWDEVGGIRKAVSLIPIFKSASGQIVKSGQTLCVLPGRAPDPTEITSRPEDDPHVKTFRNDLYRNKVSRAGHDQLNNSYLQQASGVDDDDLIDQIGSQSATVSYQQRKRKVATSTISLPKSMSDRLKQLPAQEFDVSRTKTTADSNQEHLKRMKGYIEKLRQKNEEAARTDQETAKANRTPGSIDTPATINTFPTRRPVFGKPGTLN